MGFINYGTYNYGLSYNYICGTYTYGLSITIFRVPVTMVYLLTGGITR